MKDKGTRNDTGADRSGLEDDGIGTNRGSSDGRIVYTSNDEGGAIHGGVPGRLIERHGASEESREGEDRGTKVDNRHCRSHKRRSIAHIDAG
jgi:hypothetical protein